MRASNRWCVRDESPADAERVREVVRAAFGRSDEAELVEVLRARAKPRVSLVAEREGELSGHVLFSPVWIEGTAGAPPCAGLAPVSVHPDAQRRGAGSSLVRAGLARCRNVGWKAVFLLGSPDYYARFGFAPAAPLGLHYAEAGADGEPFFQLLELEPGALRGVRGRVRFHEAFDALS